MFSTPLAIEEVVSNPNVRGGVPVLAGTTIRVADLVAYHLYGDRLTPEQLADGFHLSLGQVHAALAYYYLHQTELDNWMRDEQARGERLIAALKADGKAQRLDV